MNKQELGVEVIKYLTEFKELANKIQNYKDEERKSSIMDSFYQINQLRQKLSTIECDTIYLPPMFEYIVHSSIKINVPQKNKGIKLRSLALKSKQVWIFKKYSINNEIVRLPRGLAYAIHLKKRLAEKKRKSKKLKNPVSRQKNVWVFNDKPVSKIIDKIISKASYTVDFKRIERMLAYDFSLSDAFASDVTVVNNNENVKAFKIKDKINFDESCKKEKKEILESFSKKTNLQLEEHDIDNHSFEQMSLLKARYITYLLKELWPIIEKCYPIKKTHLPTKIFMVKLLNLVIGTEDDISLLKWNIMVTDDSYSLKLEQKNNYLEKKLESMGVDINTEMEKDGFYDEAIVFEEILSRNLSHHVRVDPYIYTKNLEGYTSDIVALIKKINSDYNIENASSGAGVNTIKCHAETYVDLRFNQCMGFKQIEDYFKDTLKISAKKIEKEIGQLVKACGLKDLESKIPRFGMYTKR